MTGLQVGIPWRPTPDRIGPFEKVRAWWEAAGFTVVAGEDPRLAHGPFNPAAARNWLVGQLAPESSHQVVVLCDADTTPEFGPLQQAMNGALRESLIHLPYHLYRNEGRGDYTPRAISGVMVFRRLVWDMTAGQDERFQGWGYEDTAWELAVTTLVGPMVRYEGTLTARSHHDAPREQLGQNIELFRAYVAAYGKQDEMLALTRGRDPRFGQRPYGWFR